VADRRVLGEAADPVTEAARVRVDETLRHRSIAQACREENIGRRASFDKPADYFGFVADKPLRRRGAMVVVAGVQIGAGVDEDAGAFDVAGEVQRRAAIAAFGVNHGGICLQHRAELFVQSETGRGVRSGRESSGYERFHRRRRNFPRVESGSQPPGDGIEIRAAIEEQLRGPFAARESDRRAAIGRLNTPRVIAQRSFDRTQIIRFQSFD
jgi:hypothetical protein